jgi:hypothetical protein
VIAAAGRGHEPIAERFLSWILLLPIGVTGLWAGLFHVFLPGTAAAPIGWEVSPFQFEVGMADLAIGVTACISFWRDLSFKAAAVSAASGVRGETGGIGRAFLQRSEDTDVQAACVRHLHGGHGALHGAGRAAEHGTQPVSGAAVLDKSRGADVQRLGTAWS